MIKSPLLLALFWLLPSLAWAARGNPIAFDASQYNPATTEFSYVVAGASARQAFMVAGHLILRVKDGRNDYSFDWGVFDPTKKDFFINYMRGKLDYEHIVRPFDETIDIYTYQRRQLREYKITLTTRQKERMLAGLIEWAKPENRTYAYDIVFRNCSTAIGDLLVDAVGPQLGTWISKPARETVRQSGLSYLAHFPPIAVFTDIVGGPAGDQPIPERGLFYLPVKFPEVLATVPAFDDQGSPISGTNLISQPTVLVPGDDIQPSATPWTLYTGLFIGIFFLLCSAAVLVRPKLLWVFAVPASLYLFFAAFIGYVLLFLVFFTLHRFAWSNLTFFFFWPFDLLAAPFLLALLWRQWRGAATRTGWTWMAAYGALHIVVALKVTLLSKVFAPITQDLTAATSLSLPFFALLTLVSLRLRFSRVAAPS